MTEPAVELLDQVWSSIIAVGAELGEDDWKLPTDVPAWSVQDHLSHLTGIERMMRGEPTPDVALGATDHVRNDLGRTNECWVESRRSWSGADVLDEFRTVTAERLAAHRALTPAQLDAIGPTPAGDAPFREYLNIRVMDSWVHEQDIRRAVGRPGNLEGPAAALTVGRVSRAMPMVVGKRAGAPEGSSVVFDVTGPAGALVPVFVVDGRARLGAEPPDEPAVTLELDVETYARLGMGRAGAAEVLAEGRATIHGDDDLGRAVLASMSFMI